MLLANANVLTMDPSRPRAECVAIRDGIIVFAGPRDAFGKSSAGGFEPVDCGGRTILPGFIDAHCHLRAFADSLVSLDLGPDNGYPLHRGYKNRRRESMSEQVSRSLDPGREDTTNFTWRRKGTRPGGIWTTLRRISPSN